MYQIGDKIFYPMHGASVIEAIEEREILGKKTIYYVMNIKNMQVMFPKGSKVGIRQIVDSDILEDVLKNFNLEESDVIPNPTHRYRSNMNKMKSGNIYEGAQVIRDLIRMAKKRALASGDKNMLDNAKQILTSELMLVKGINQEQADDLLDNVFNN
jgi:CarD family transcriptional regulator